MHESVNEPHVLKGYATSDSTLFSLELTSIEQKFYEVNNKTIIELGSRKILYLSAARRSIICHCPRHRQIIDLLAPEKSR